MYSLQELHYVAIIKLIEPILVKCHSDDYLPVQAIISTNCAASSEKPLKRLLLEEAAKKSL